MDSRRRVEDLEELVDLGHLLEQAVDAGRNLIEARDQHGREAHEGHDLADTGLAVLVQGDAGDEDCRHGQGRGGAGGDVGEGPPGQDRDLRGEQVADDIVHRVLLRLGAGKGLDDGNVAQGIRGVLGQARLIGLDPTLKGLGTAHDHRGQGGKGENEHDQDRAELPVHEQGHRQENDQRHEGHEVVAEEAEPEPEHTVRTLQHRLQDTAEWFEEWNASGSSSTCSK